jgi:galactokinase
MGDHTDYNDGFVLPAAIELECRVHARPAAGRVTLRSGGRPAVDVAADGSDDPAGVQPEWGRYVAAVVSELAALGRNPAGIDGEVESSVPEGAGLSSSAALEVAAALVLADVGDLAVAPLELALACQRAEHAATGVPSGIMDQLASICGRAGHALLIDCRSLELRPVALPASLRIVVVHSGLLRELGRTAYAARRAECERDAAELGLRSLRDALPDQVADRPRARHVVSENGRVLATAAALERGDAGELSRLLNESHASLRDDFEVSTPELDLLARCLVEAGARGARLTGAGFGGCVVALAAVEDAAEVATRAAAAYATAARLEPRVWLPLAADGAGPLP